VTEKAMGRMATGLAIAVLMLTPCALADQPCTKCGPGDHWIDTCSGGTDFVPATYVELGIDLEPFLCEPDTTVAFSGDLTVVRTGPLDDSAYFPGSAPVDEHLDVIDAEITQMVLTGPGGETLIAGVELGQGGVLQASLGTTVEDPSDSGVGDSFFNVYFEIDLGGGQYVYNHEPLVMSADITCVPPIETFTITEPCIAVYDFPPGLGRASAGVEPFVRLTEPFLDLPLPHIVSDCDMICKDGRGLHAEAFDPFECHFLCDDFCGANEAVLSCLFQGQNVKGNCEAECKDGTSGHTTATSPGECHFLCDDLCGGDKLNVLACSFKGENVKGNCEAVCKDGTSGHTTTSSYGECHLLCDDLCGGDKLNVQACFFKGEYVKGKPDIPTVSAWGIAIMVLLLLVGAKVYYGRLRAARV
jgi:hypothetical protein